MLSRLSFGGKTISDSIFGLMMMIIGLLVGGVFTLHQNQLRYLPLGHTGRQMAKLGGKAAAAEDNVSAAAAAAAALVAAAEAGTASVEESDLKKNVTPAENTEQEVDKPQSSTGVHAVTSSN